MKTPFLELKNGQVVAAGQIFPALTVSYSLHWSLGRPVSVIQIYFSLCDDVGLVALQIMNGVVETCLIFA